MAKPLVSAIVPVHDAERFLGAALDSALAQDYRPMEIIVVDDGSTDRSVEVARTRSVRILGQSNRGAAAARNAGVAAARGDLLAFLDADDLWLPTKISRQVAFLDRRPELEMVQTRMKVVLEPGTPRPAFFNDHWDDGDERGCIPSSWLVRRELFERVGGFDEHYMACDTDWLARAKDAGVRWASVPEPLLHYRLHGGNQTYRLAEIRAELLRMLRASVARQAGATGNEGGERGG